MVDLDSQNLLLVEPVLLEDLVVVVDVEVATIQELVLEDLELLVKETLEDLLELLQEQMIDIVVVEVVLEGRDQRQMMLVVVPAVMEFKVLSAAH